MPVINQTNRTIAFESFNPNAPDLLTLIGEVVGVDSLTDDKIKEINDALLVKSFDEFLQKFNPVVYSYFNANSQTVAYTLKYPEGLDDASITEIPLGIDNDFLKMLLTMLTARDGAGQKNVDFDFESVTKLITPAKVMDDIRQVRKEISYLHGKYEALDESDPQRLDLADSLNERFDVASKNYNNIMSMIPILLEDVKTRILLGAGENGGDNIPFKAGMLTIGEQGELKIVEKPQITETTDLALLENTNQIALAEHFAEDFDEISENPTDYVRDLVVRTFAPLPAVTNQEIDYAKEIENYNNYLAFYKQSKDDFVKVAKPLIEKIIGVKLFFDQYKAKSKTMTPSLLITNTPVEMLTKANNLPRLEKYLATTNMKNDFANTIWFGIVSGVSLNTSEANANRRQRFQGNEKKETVAENNIANLGSLLNVLSEYKVQLFFSFESGEETTFDGLSKKGAGMYIEKCEPLSKRKLSAYAIPTYPNFTLVPKNKSGVLLDRKMVETESGAAAMGTEKEDYMRLWLEGIYVPSSYVAAGITVASQCPGHLREYFKNVEKNTPGVRFDIEARDHSLRVITSMAKEISGYTQSVKTEINRLNFGFCFASENASVDGMTVSNITVYKARTLAEGNNGFEEIYKTLVATYIERLLRYESNDFKMDNINHFFSSNPTSTRSQWVNSTGDVNSIIQPGDDLGYNIDDRQEVCEIDLVFNGNTKNLEVEINKTVNQVG